MSALSKLLGRANGAAVAARLLLRGLSMPRPASVDLTQRLGAIVGTLPVQRRVLIHWNDQQIPFIEAASDDDLAVALGAVHAHLRLAQMEVMRRIATGRVAEVVGPLGLSLDRTLRLFDFGRAAPGIAAMMPEATRRWCEAFLRGVNAQIASAALPPEYALLGIPREPWTLTDLLTVSRLAATDVNWIVWSRLLRARGRMQPEQWEELWPTLLRGGVNAPGIGSNAAAVAARRSRSGGALLAADPHLSLSLPNIWLAVGMSSPGYNCAGLMPAGLPVMAIGRNPWLAWGGTSLHAASSDLFDASGLALSEREATIHVRGAPPDRIRLRESALGPIVSDAGPMRNRSPLALRWVGHEPSDEFSAMLGVMRARSAEAFTSALQGFAVPAQTMIHAGRDGRVGRILAGRVPRRSMAPPADLVLDPARLDAWSATENLAARKLNPEPPDVVASANDRPPEGETPVGFFYSPPDRIERMRALLGGDAFLTRADMERLMLDVRVPRALRLRDHVLPRLSARDASTRAAKALADWDGCYDGASQGAVVHEVLQADLAFRLFRRRDRMALSAVWTSRELIVDGIVATSDQHLAPALHAAIRRADIALRRWERWDRMHRVRLRHILAMIPLFHSRFTYGDLPAEGGNDTLNKSGHLPARGRHTATYGASARFVADLADPDSNGVVLLGGQDGWLGSVNFLDQVEAWRRGAFIDLPLQAETARHWPHHTVHQPRETDGT